MVFLFLCTACSPHSLEDFQHEGEAVSKQLIVELKKIETREDLLKALPRLKEKFEKLVDLMIEARKCQLEGDEYEIAVESNTLISEALAQEMKRIYRLEAGRELIEKAQKEALLRLDAFEAKLRLKK